MNPFVVAGAVLLVGVLVGYVIITRREIARLPPLETKPPGETPQLKKREDADKPVPASAKPGSIADKAAMAEGYIAEGERPKTDPPKPG